MINILKNKHTSSRHFEKVIQWKDYLNNRRFFAFLFYHDQTNSLIKNIVTFNINKIRFRLQMQIFFYNTLSSNKYKLIPTDKAVMITAKRDLINWVGTIMWC